jgi:hypothetical protein
VSDEGSTNGTWLNGELVVQPTVMTVDDELCVGPYRVMVQSLMGAANSGCPRLRLDRAQRSAPPPVEVSARAVRPQTNDRATDVRLSQAQVFWRLLGFQEPGTLEQARAAYQARVDECHPDTVSQLNPQLRELAEQRLREVEFAWAYIQRLFQRARDAA